MPLAAKAATELAAGRAVRTRKRVVSLRDVVRTMLELEPVQVHLLIPEESHASTRATRKRRRSRQGRRERDGRRRPRESARAALASLDCRSYASRNTHSDAMQME
jgi:hypothetical protein